MLVSAVSSYAVAVHTGQPWLGLLAAGLAGTAMAAVFALLVLNLRANQVATGLALTLFGIGLSWRRGKQECSERDDKSETPSLPIGAIGRKPARSKALNRLRSKSVPSRYDTR